MHITATLGPASLSKNITEQLSKKASRFRLNSGHMDAPQLRLVLKELEATKIPVVIDLQGAKIRIGEFKDTAFLPAIVCIINDTVSSDVGYIPLPDKQFFRAIKPKDRLYLNDARIELEVINTSDKKIDAAVIKNGALSSFKSINRKDHPVHFAKISDADKKIIGASLKFAFVEYAVSFVHNGEEAKLFRPLVKNKRLIAKIERPEAMCYLNNIHRNFDELWFCRGDMGSQAGLDKLQGIQEEFIKNSKELSKPKFIAGRLLWSMVDNPSPTQAELEHLYSINNVGFEGLVLSDETAIGRDPLKVLDLVLNIF